MCFRRMVAFGCVDARGRRVERRFQGREFGFERADPISERRGCLLGGRDDSVGDGVG